MKKVLIVGAGKMQVPVIKMAKELGYFCIVSDFDSNAPGFKYADVSANISTKDLDAHLELASKYSIDGILTTSDYPVRTVAFVCQALGLKGIGSDAAQICTDKYLQRQHMDSTVGYLPEYFLVSSIEEVSSFSDRLHYPLIIKPVDSSASRGVKRVSNIDELFEAVGYALNYSSSKKVIIEEFITGPEYSVESLTKDGVTHVIAITEKRTYGENGNFFVESMHIVPAVLSEDDENAVIDFTKRVIKCFKIDNSATHLELKLSEKGPVLIEVGARLGGDYITSDLVPLATGVSMLKNVLKLALNEDLDITATLNSYAAIQFINADNYVKAQELVKENHESVIDYEFNPFKNVMTENSSDRLGYIIATSTDRASLIDLLGI